MNRLDVSISPLPSTPSPQGGFVAMFTENAALRGKDAAVSWIAQDGIHTLNWENYLRRVRTVASAFLALGLDTGDTVAIAAANRVEHLVADWTCIHCRAVTVTACVTLAHQQLDHVIADCKPRILVLENVAMLRKFVALDWVKAHRPHIVVIGDEGAADVLSGSESADGTGAHPSAHVLHGRTACLGEAAHGVRAGARQAARRRPRRRQRWLITWARSGSVRSACHCRAWTWPSPRMASR